MISRIIITIASIVLLGTFLYLEINSKYKIKKRNDSYTEISSDSIKIGYNISYTEKYIADQLDKSKKLKIELDNTKISDKKIIDSLILQVDDLINYKKSLVYSVNKLTESNNCKSSDEIISGLSRKIIKLSNKNDSLLALLDSLRSNVNKVVIVDSVTTSNKIVNKKSRRR